MRAAAAAGAPAAQLGVMYSIALSYYYDNPAEIEASFEEDERWEAEHERANLAERSHRPR